LNEIPLSSGPVIVQTWFQRFDQSMVLPDKCIMIAQFLYFEFFPSFFLIYRLAKAKLRCSFVQLCLLQQGFSGHRGAMNIATGKIKLVI
jgi:hypothetical protein